MQKKFRDVVDSLDFEELMKIKHDLDTGATHISDLIDTKIKQKQNEHKQYCSVCQSEIDSNSTSTYTLIFGPHDFRKKATFCAMDCMEFFLDNLKKIKNPKKDLEEQKVTHYDDNGIL